MRYAFVNKCYNSKIGVRKTLTVCRYSNRKVTCTSKTCSIRTELQSVRTFGTLQSINSL